MDNFWSYIIFGALIGWLWDLFKKKGASSKPNNNSNSNSFDDETSDTMGPFKFRIRKSKFTFPNTDITKPVFEIEGKGILIPNDAKYKKKHLGYSISIFDITDKNPMPIMTVMDAFKEPETNCYFFSGEIGIVEKDVGYPKWISLNKIIPEYLQAPKSGKRKLEIVLRLIDWNKKPTIYKGFIEPKHSSRVIWEDKKTISYNFDNNGYREEAKNKLLANELIIKIGVIIAMSDGKLHAKEGEKIKDWMEKNILSLDEKNQKIYKTKYNNAFREMFNECKTKKVSLTSIINKLKKLKNKKAEYEAIEMAYKIVAADELIASNEMKVIDKLIKLLNLDKNEIEKIRDQNILGLEQENLSEDNLLISLGIDPKLSEKEIKEKLTIEFQKWNNRLNIVDIKNRKEVQVMLDRIALARKKYK